MITFTGTDLLTSNMLYTTLPFLTHADKPGKEAALVKVIGV